MTLGRRLKAQANVDLTPLIDVVFQLVIFFMISSTFKTTPGIALDLPDSATAQAVQVAELGLVAVSSEEVYVNRVRTTAAGAASVIRTELEGLLPEDVQATLEAEAGAPYQLVVDLLDALRRNGVSSVGLSTRPPRAGP